MGVLEDEFVVGFFDEDGVAGFESAFDDFFGEGVFEEFFDGAAKGAGAILRVEAFLDEKFRSLRRHFDLDALVFEALGDFIDFENDDLADVIFVKRMEDDDIVEAV